MDDMLILSTPSDSVERASLDMGRASKNLTLGSLFDGSGGFPLGGLLANVLPVWASEIEPFPIRITTKRLPFMKHLGDISTVNGARIEPVDIITFGSPCTDMSIAGKRAGLDGSQSCLFYEAIRIVKEMRCATNEEYPRFIVWENVPGAFSSNNGEDFRSVLEALCSIKGDAVSVPKPPGGKWSRAGEIMADNFSLAWRVLDAQFWGVPQRRKRIYLVADFASRSAGRILFESEGVSRYSAAGFRSWQRTAGRVADRVGAAGGICLNDQGGKCMNVSVDVSGTLRAQMDGHPPCVLDHGDAPKTLKIRSGCAGGGKGALIQEDVSATLSCNNDQTVFVPTGKETCRNELPVRAYGVCSKDSNAMKSKNPRSGFYEAETSRTLDAHGGNPGCNQGGIAVVAVQGSIIDRDDRNDPQGSGVDEDVCFSLTGSDRHAVSYSTYCMSKNSHFTQAERELANTLVAVNYKDPPIINDVDEVKYIVRRLTPTECARLQGFPDWWCSGLETKDPTDADISFWRTVFETHRKVVGRVSRPKSDKQIIKWLTEPHSDSAEYKMWGNGVALPCVFFVLAGIVWSTQMSGN